MRVLFLIVLVACKGEFVAEPPPKPPEIVVGLASTRLGADCNEARPEENKPAGVRIPCDQTAVHLAVRSLPSATPTTIKMKRVELLDRNGALLEVLTAHSPSRWGTDAFVAWDERSVPGKVLSVGYKLSSPDWSKIPNANKRTFKMRVTVTVGSEDQTLEATAELRMEDTSNIVT